MLRRSDWTAIREFDFPILVLNSACRQRSRTLMRLFRLWDNIKKLNCRKADGLAEQYPDDEARDRTEKPQQKHGASIVCMNRIERLEVGIESTINLMTGKLSVVIEQDEHGCYAWCPELKGCQSQGHTFDEALVNIREAIELFLETLTDEERSAALCREILTTAIEVHA